MEDILKTVLLEYDKSTFLIDLIKHTDGALYVSIEQHIESNNDNKDFQKIKINPLVIGDIIEVLKNYKKTITGIKEGKIYFSDERKSEICKFYLKGINVADIALKYGCSQIIIEQILTSSNIEIVDNYLEKKRKNMPK